MHASSNGQSISARKRKEKAKTTSKFHGQYFPTIFFLHWLIAKTSSKTAYSAFSANILFSSRFTAAFVAAFYKERACV